MSVFVERAYDVGHSKDAAKLVINEPILTTKDWVCVYSIDVRGERITREVLGVDKLQAFTIALHQISAELNYLNEQRKDKITWMGDSRLELI